MKNRKTGNKKEIFVSIKININNLLLIPFTCIISKYKINNPKIPVSKYVNKKNVAS
jgi:hypothetical protein